jgi:ubiquinone/menaquinone biosynthesis C-methylase UbiE
MHRIFIKFSLVFCLFIFVFNFLSAAPLDQNRTQTYDFWNNPEIVKNYASGGNATQLKRYFKTKDFLKKHPIKDAELIVDIGAGTGEISAQWAMNNLNGIIFAVDYSDAMVRIAQERIGSLGLSNIHIWCSDAMDLKLPTETGTIDRMISYTAIHWFPHIGKFLEGVNKYLKPGGSFYFRFAGCDGDETLELAEEIRKEARWINLFAGFINPMHAHGLSEIRARLQKEGMVCESAFIWENVEKFANADLYAKYVKGWLPHLYHLQNEEDQEEFLKELVEKHCSRLDRQFDGDKIFVKDTQIEMWGYKPLRK